MDENTITTVFKADISQFSSSTQQLNQYIKTVNSEFDVATSTLGKWSDSTDGLTAKITQLNKVLEAEKMKLSDMKKRYEEMVAAGKENTKEAKNLAIQINQQTAKINKAEKQTEDYTKSLEELQKAGVKTKKELDELTAAQEKQGKSAEGIAGKIAKGLGGAALGIAGAATGVVSGFLAMGESTREFRKEQAQLETAFTQAGHSVETMQKTYEDFNSVLGDTSKSQETMLHLAKFTKSEEELGKYTHALTGVFAEFGASLPTESLAENINLAIQTGDAIEGGLADALEWGGVNLDDFKTKLEACSTEEQRSQLILGKLTELYGESATAYKENNKDIIEAEKAQTRLTQAMADLGAVAEPIMTSLKNAFSGLLESIKPFVELLGTGLKDALNGSSEGAKQFAEGLSGIIKTLLDKANEMIPNLINMFVELIPNLINVVVSSLPSIVTTLSGAIAQIVGSLGDIIPAVIQVIIDTIPELVQSIVDALPLFLDGAMQLILGIVEALPTLIESLVASLPTIIQSIVDALVSFTPQLVDASITLLMALVDAIPTIIEALIPQIPTIVNALVDGLISMLPVLLDGAVKLMMALIDAIPIIIQKLIPQIPKIVTSIVKTLTSKIDVLIQGALELLEGIIKAIPLVIKELIPQIPTIITSIVEGLIEGIPDMMEAGKDLIKGLWDGIKSMADWLWEKVKGFCGGVVDKIKGFFGIESPSKLFKTEIGKNLALGIGDGFTDEMGDVTKDMQNSLDKMTNNLDVDNSGIIGFDNMSTPSWVEQLFNMIKNQNVVNNYQFDYKFEKMETSKLALHKAALQTKRAIGG